MALAFHGQSMLDDGRPIRVPVQCQVLRIETVELRTDTLGRKVEYGAGEAVPYKDVPLDDGRLLRDAFPTKKRVRVEFVPLIGKEMGTFVAHDEGELEEIEAR